MDLAKHVESGDRRCRPADMRIDFVPAADGWPLRRFDWPAATDGPPRGSLLFQGGRGDFIEKYLEPLGHWHRAGWQLRGFDWRGQGGSGRFLADPAIGHAPDFARWVDDLDAIVADWLATTPGPHVLVGHSMGGHLVLRLLAERRPQVDAAILLAPMLGFAASGLPAWLARGLSAIACRLGLAERAAWGGGRDAMPAHRQRNLTHSAARYADELWWRAQHPELVVGAPSWGWIHAAAESMAGLARREVLATVETPLLILATRQDKLVDAKAIARAARFLPDARLHWFDHGAHELLRESDAVRLPALAAIDRFLEEVAR
ncbi:lysophospholipase [Sphingomonas laterariae]|uniref:Lysophospholipase n=1 Tax=Edaphosphingomonas laterariae TaxID=861865 RepID=A0A239I7W2_9SPHN|nr:alpha/beta hydrolase [Sphingomonas laterariae]SNS89472.1 lysophospholipase [Sphingomonas laterariae]